MKLTLSWLMLGLSSICALAQTESETAAPELGPLRESYRNAVLRSETPLKQTYLTELNKLRDELVQAGKTAAADAVREEIALVVRQIADAARGKVTVMDALVTIPANDPNGYSFGPVHQGDVITLSYQRGLWKNMGRIASDNPDAVVTEKGDASRLVIAKAPQGNTPGAVLQMVPPQTAAQPFTYEVPASSAALVLRISGNSNDRTNPGFVTYRLTLTR